MKPWMKRREGETVQQWNDRTNRTCYGCGTEHTTVKKCDEHEETCPSCTQGKKKK